MRVLLCGGAGFIGSVLVRKLLEANNEVTVFDNFSTGHKEAVKICKVIEGDLLNFNSIDGALKTSAFNLVINLSGNTASKNSFEEPYLCLKSNITASLNLVEAMKQNSVKRLIFASSSEIYGKADFLPVNEDSDFGTETVFSETLVFIERIFGWYDLLFGIKTISLRLFEVAGAMADGSIGEDKGALSSDVSVLSKAALSDGVFRMHGSDFETYDGTYIKDYVHVEDVAEAFIKSAEHLSKKPKSEIFNVCSSHGFSVKDVITEVELQTGRKINTVTSPRRKGDVDSLWADNKKAKTELSWEPKNSLADIVRSSLYWHAKRPGGFDLR